MNLSAWWAETLWHIALGVSFALLIGFAAFVGRPRRHVSNRERQPSALAPNELWSMDFVSDALFDGRRL